MVLIFQQVTELTLSLIKWVGIWFWPTTWFNIPSMCEDTLNLVIRYLNFVMFNKFKHGWNPKDEISL